MVWGNLHLGWAKLFEHLHCGIWFAVYGPLYIALSIREPDLFYKCPHRTWSNFKLHSSLVYHSLNLNLLPNLILFISSSPLTSIKLRFFCTIANYPAWISIIKDSSQQATWQDGWIISKCPNNSQTSKPLAFGSLFLCLDRPSFPLTLGHLCVSFHPKPFLTFPQQLPFVGFLLSLIRPKIPHGQRPAFLSPALCKLGIGGAAVLHKDLLQIEYLVNHEVNPINTHTSLGSQYLTPFTFICKSPTCSTLAEY